MHRLLGTLRTLRAARHRSVDEGMVTAFVVIFALALVLVAGLVVDGGRLLSEHRQTGNLADSAARAGAQAISEDAVRNGSAVVLDEGAAEAAACAFLTRADHACDGSTTFANAVGNRVDVTVHGTVDLLLLPGGSQSLSAEGSACVAIGIDQATSVC